MNFETLADGFIDNMNDPAYVYAHEKTGLFAPTPSETELYAHWAMNMPDLLEEFEDAMNEYGSWENN